ncbi:MAG: hypothetical protein RR357_01595 [Clostridia bacterium]
MAVEKHSLTKKERALLHVIISMAEKNSEAICLVKPLDVFKALPYDLDYTPDELEPMMKGLQLDDYFDFIVTDKKGDLIYCVTMHQKGLSFARVERAWRKSLLNRILITAAMGIVSGTVVFLVKLLLSQITGKG